MSLACGTRLGPYEILSAEGTETADLPMGWTTDGQYLHLFARPARSMFTTSSELYLMDGLR